MKTFLNEFKEFINRGNVMDLAVGVIIGGAFTSIVTALTDHIINRQNEPIDSYPHGSFPELMAYIDRAAGEE